MVLNCQAPANAVVCAAVLETLICTLAVGGIQQLIIAIGRV
jgi:hypothetical protein